MVKKILCFGDSNTFGFIPNVGGRFPQGVRWTSVLAESLGEDYKIFEAGCNNRACFVEHIDGEKFIGKKFIKKYSQYDFEYIITCLGANDLQKNYSPSVEELERGFRDYINILKSTFSSKIIILAPSQIKDKVLNTWFNELFDETSVEKSKFLASVWERVATENDCYFVNLNDKITASDIDGLHYDEENHKIIAEELARYILSF